MPPLFFWARLTGRGLDPPVRMAALDRRDRLPPNDSPGDEAAKTPELKRNRRGIRAMTVDDLTAPLGRQPKKRRRTIKIPVTPDHRRGAGAVSWRVRAMGGRRRRSIRRRADGRRAGQSARACRRPATHAAEVRRLRRNSARSRRDRQGRRSGPGRRRRQYHDDDDHRRQDRRAAGSGGSGAGNDRARAAPKSPPARSRNSSR